MATTPIFEETRLQSICDVLADTSAGLTGSEIGRILSGLSISDPFPGNTKRHRLYEALKNRQRQDGCGNLVVAFIYRAMDPVRYTSDRGGFESRRDELNKVLAFCGYKLGEDGKLRSQTAARTLSEAEERASRLKAALQRRDVHHDVLTFCRAELLDKNCFHAVLEATKSVAEKIRSKSGFSGDGAELIDHAFGLGKGGTPFLAFNTLQTETERGEHSGMINLMKGMFGAFRNPTAHAPRISWNITEQDALDLMTIASFLHRRLDGSVRTGRITLPIRRV
ncbi:MAG: TIGR02391 family protein [Elusimicrobia bacterium RIFCSPLOWO2_12_FULL_59_9]|nr:MAG: TIGR02391 family protein [Elusimicrobia bacterium RIFCSPLOWO2_12_FULL_59_9]